MPKLELGPDTLEKRATELAVSQHPAKRDKGNVAARRESPMIWYRIAKQQIETFLVALYCLFRDRAMASQSA